MPLRAVRALLGQEIREVFENGAGDVDGFGVAPPACAVIFRLHFDRLPMEFRLNLDELTVIYLVTRFEVQFAGRDAVGLLRMVEGDSVLAADYRPEFRNLTSVVFESWAGEP